MMSQFRWYASWSSGSAQTSSALSPAAGYAGRSAAPLIGEWLMSHTAGFILVAAAVLGSCISWPIAQGGEDRTVVLDRPWAKSAGALAAMLVLADTSEKVAAALEKLDTVVVSGDSDVVNGRVVLAVVLLRGCAANKRGVCDVTVRYTLSKPEGTVYGRSRNDELWSGKPPPTDGRVRTGIRNMGLVVDASDPAAVFTVRAEVHDKVSKKKLELVRIFTAVEDQAKP